MAGCSALSAICLCALGPNLKIVEASGRPPPSARFAVCHLLRCACQERRRVDPLLPRQTGEVALGAKRRVTEGTSLDDSYCVGSRNSAATAAAAARARAAPHNAAAWKAAISAGPRAASTPPTRAMAITPPSWATALLRPEAAPVCLASTALSTAEVSGATAQAMPSATVATAGSTVVQ